MNPQRREFLLSALTATAALGVGRIPGWASAQGQAVAEPPTRDRLGELLPLRRLGRTEAWVTNLGVGGSHIEHSQSARQAQALIEAALEEGVRFFDNAQRYGYGRSEKLFGQFLTPKYRDAVYLMTKTAAKTRKQAQLDMDGCRKRMGVDTIDLMQMHHLHHAEDVDQRIRDGVVDVLLEARERGKIRHLGFTGHDSPSAHLHMLKRLDEMGVQFDTAQMPVNVVDPGYESFTLQVLPELVKRDYGVIAMKTLVYGQLLGQNKGWGRPDRIAPPVVPERMSLEEALGFVWSLPVSTLVSGMPELPMVKQNAGIARAHASLDEAQRQKLIEKAADFAGPRIEFYKTEV